MANSAKPLSGITVLVVEDEFILATEIIAILETAGAAILGPAANVAKSLRLIRNGGIDVTLLDYRLGREFSSPLADLLRLQSQPYFFHSGSCAEVARIHPDACCVEKPSNAKQLIAAVSALHAMR